MLLRRWMTNGEGTGLVRKGAVRTGFVKSGFEVTKQWSPPKAVSTANKSEAHAIRGKCVNLRKSSIASRDNAVSFSGGGDIGCDGPGWDFMERLRRRVNKRRNRPLSTAWISV